MLYRIRTLAVERSGNALWEQAAAAWTTRRRCLVPCQGLHWPRMRQATDLENFTVDYCRSRDGGMGAK